MKPFMEEVPPEAPDQATVMVSSTNTAGEATTEDGPLGTVFFLTLPVSFQPE
jgi:hypothetical protein